ncbi:MAG: hypothetical protein FWG91_12150 [Lachnospiraceae bacterium]|nr:hypothetical protein [Lachnospiraceae bacterium]
MSYTEAIFIKALEGKKIPILTLDNKWHRLFTQYNPSPQMKKWEEEINKMLKRQGKLSTELKEIKILKKKLMDEIVTHAEEVEQGNKKAEKKLDENKRLINECNEKIEAYNDELLDLPALIDGVNYNLMLHTMEICYEQIQNNTAEIKEIAEWINQIRKELKKKIIRKQEKEILNNNLYQYMHQLFGGEVIEIFDMQYNPDIKKIFEPEKVKVTEFAEKPKEQESIGDTASIKNNSSIKDTCGILDNTDTSSIKDTTEEQLAQMLAASANASASAKAGEK